MSQATEAVQVFTIGPEAVGEAERGGGGAQRHPDGPGPRLGGGRRDGAALALRLRCHLGGAGRAA